MTMQAPAADTQSLWDQFPEGAPRDLVRAGVDAFAARGYAATTTRQIGREAGLSAAGMYVHFASKADLLHTLSRVGHQDAATTLYTALDVQLPAVGRITHATDAFARWHAENHRLARVVQYELSSLEPAAYQEIAELRRGMQRRLVDEIQSAVDDGSASVPDVAGVARALLSLCIDVCRWYDPAGPQAPQAIGALYAELARRWLQSAVEG